MRKMLHIFLLIALMAEADAVEFTDDRNYCLRCDEFLKLFRFSLFFCSPFYRDLFGFLVMSFEICVYLRVWRGREKSSVLFRKFNVQFYEVDINLKWISELRGRNIKN